MQSVVKPTPKPVLFDCDPGIDDVFALAMAHGSPGIGVEAVTTTFGNVGIDNTTNNALRVLEWIGCDAPVYRGVPGALLTESVDVGRATPLQVRRNSRDDQRYSRRCSR